MHKMQIKQAILLGVSGILILMLLSITQVNADTSSGQVSINNVGPTVGTVGLTDSNGGAIQLAAASNTNTVTCNATLTDSNGYADIESASAKFYHSTSTSAASDDKNEHYTNASCTLAGGSGLTIVATCTINLEHESKDGTWTCNISTTDGTTSSSDIGTQTVDSLASLDVTEASINFGSLGLGENSSSAQSIEVNNTGNIQIDARYSGADYSCTVGTLVVGSTRYSTSTGNYDSMATDLTTGPTTQTSFDLGIEGVATAEDVTSVKNEFFTIALPSTGIGGTCTNIITITAIAG